jgi:hypothetical protein
LQCLVVAIRPLRVEELAEVLAVDFGDEEGMAKLNPNWRWEDQERALLTSCSSLIAIVESDESRVVQFSHFSVKEFLTSARLATSSGDTSRYHWHIVLEHAHTILAQACLSVLLRTDDPVEEGGVRNSSPLAKYAAEHWVAHAQYEKASSCLRKAMENLFDWGKPYFASWLQLHDIDDRSQSGPDSTFYHFALFTKSRATPLYYAALCGFQDLVEHLIVNDPEQVNAKGGHHLAPLVAALAAGHFQTAKTLHDNGAHPNISGLIGRTPLHSAAYYGEIEMVQVLLKYKADVAARTDDGETPLHFASEGSRQGCADVARLLLKHGADVNAQRNSGSTPLHVAETYNRTEVVRVLLEHGASVGAKNGNGETALQVASNNENDEKMELLSEHDAS